MVTTALARRTSTSLLDPVSAVLGLVVVGSVYADGYAHVNIGGLETFFTPWHAALYGSFVVLAAWTGASVRGRRAPGTTWRTAVPAGYGWGVVGVATFALGGLLDMVWHLAFGVEAGIDALVSPTHLVLLIGGVLLLSSPLRAALAARSSSPALPWTAVLSTAAVAGLAAFFLSYLSVFTEPGAVTALPQVTEAASGHQAAEIPAIAGLGGYLVTTLLVVVPTLFLRRVGRPPRGTVLVLTAAVTVPPAVLGRLEYAVPLLGALVAAALVDGLLDSRPAAVVASVLPGGVWAGQLAGLAVTGDLAWPAELWAGVTVLTVLEGLALARLTEPSGVLAQRHQITAS